MSDYEISEILITKKKVNASISLKRNQRAAKRKEKRTSFFDFSTKIYKLVQLKSSELLDLTNCNDMEKEVVDNSFLEPPEILKCIHNCGIVGLGGGGFSANQKIEATQSASNEEKILIINAVECDPGLLHDEWLLTNKLAQIEIGICEISKRVPFKRIIVASRHKIETISVICNIDVEFLQLDYFYPLGEEHILLKKALGINLDKNEIPAEHGLLVFNVQTVYAIGQAVTKRQVLRSRYITAADLTTGYARIVKVPVGANAVDVLKQAMGSNEKATMYIGEDIMGSRKMIADDVIDVKTNFVAYAKPINFANPSACIGCGVCAKKCPFNIPIGGIISYTKFGQSFSDDITNKCIGCNACAYFCKAGINTKCFVDNQNKKV